MMPPRDVHAASVETKQRRFSFSTRSTHMPGLQRRTPRNVNDHGNTDVRPSINSNNSEATRQPHNDHETTLCKNISAVLPAVVIVGPSSSCHRPSFPVVVIVKEAIMLSTSSAANTRADTSYDRGTLEEN